MGRIIAGLLEEGDDSAQNKRLTSCRIAMEKVLKCLKNIFN